MHYEFEILEKSIVYDGFFNMEKYRLRHRLFAGGWSPEITRECMERGHAVAVLPYDPERDEIILLEQFRIGALGAPGGPWLLEIVAGIIDPGETKLDVARREAQEEAGCELLDMVPIGDFLVSPGGTFEGISMFCARVDTSRLGGVHGLDAEDEDIYVHVVPRSEALGLFHGGRITSASTLIALQWLELNRNDVLARWSYLE